MKLRYDEYAGDARDVIEVPAEKKESRREKNHGKIG